VTTFIGGTVDQGMTSAMDFELSGMAGSNTANLEVSGIPTIDMDRRLRYLLNYPHGCVEQVTSTVFPQLFLTDIVEFSDKDKAQVDVNIKAAILKLRTFQQSGGGFAYWPGQSYYNSWGTSYAGHFLLEAEKKGYSLPPGMKSAWLKSQRQLARQWMPDQHNDPYYHGDLEQAYRLYTLALGGEPEMSAMNRLRESKYLSIQSKWRLAAAYALSGQASVARELIGRETTEIQPYKGLYSSYGSRERDWAMMLETMIILDDKVKAAMLTKKISEALSSGQWMSTQTTAFCLMAVSKFSEIGNASSGVKCSYKMANGKVINVVSDKSVVKIPLPINNAAMSGSVYITNNGQGILFTRIIMEGIPEAGQEKEFSNNLTLDIDYLSMDGNSLDVSKINQGTDFLVRVTVYNPGEYYYRDLALTQVFPPGWEITNNRLWDNELAVNKDNPSYQDIRDDRIFTYFDLGEGERKSFTVQLNATYLGKYYLTGVYCEAMYDNNISAMQKGKWVEILTAGK